MLHLVERWKVGWHCSNAFQKLICGADRDNTSCLIKNLKQDDDTLVRAATNYPILDFASGPRTWYNAEVGKTKPSINLSAFCTVMQLLDLASFTEEEGLSVYDKNKRIILYLVHNCDNEEYEFERTKPMRKHKGFNPDQVVEEVFKKYVDVVFLNVKKWDACDILDAENKRTEQLLKYYGVLE